VSDVHGADAGDTVAVVRRIAAPREIVFAFLTDPARFVQWMGVGAKLDPRPGGAYQITVGPGAVASGHYQVVEPPNRLVFTWGWRGDADVPPGSTTVEVVLLDDGGGTLLELRHRGLPHEDSRRSHTQGWGRYLASLTEVAEVERTRGR
jgi:uncharacterized protein YndB with AHSA1/START domain